MGEVYRARDPRLGREIALKIVAGEGPASEDRLRRFDQEARAVAALQHPGILAVHDTGTHEGCAYVVFELLEGETLRERLARGALPARKAVEIAVEIARALAAAHARGVVHRDVKPENVFLVREGHVKLLDFGLAALAEAPAQGDPDSSLDETDRAGWMGTAGYAAPEQLRGHAGDARADIFALGALLYEMLSGRRAFDGPTRADRLLATVDRDPASLTAGGTPAPPALEKLVRRCLEKDADDRFQSARDVAFALDALAAGATESIASALPVRPRRRVWPLAAGLAGLVAAAAGGFLAGRRPEVQAPAFRQLTFRSGWLDQARFAPDGRLIVFGAGWEGRPVELFQTRTDSPEARALALPHAKVLSISPRGQMAVLLDPARGRGYFSWGTLAVVPLAGGTPRELLEGVISADWTPDGHDLCVSRLHPDGEVTLELPPGTVLDWVPRTRASADTVRVSRDGRYIVYRDLGTGKVMLADRERRRATSLVDMGAGNLWGIAWAPSGREVWFTEGAGMGLRDLHAVDLEGRRRLVYRSTSSLSLVDTTPDGRALFHRALDRNAALALLPGGRAEQDVTVYDSSRTDSLSADGRTLLLNSPCEGAGPGSCAYVRRDGGEPVLVAAGRGLDISPDGRSALVSTDSDELRSVPIGPGLPSRFEIGGLRVHGAAFAPGGGLIACGRLRPEEPEGLWAIAGSTGSSPRRLDAEAVQTWAISPDGRQVAVKTGVDTISLVPVDGSPRRDVQVAGVSAVSRWGRDGQSLFIRTGEGWPCDINRLDLTTGRTGSWIAVVPPDPVGIILCYNVLLSDDGRSYAYTINRSLASLMLADGLR
jgi:hypothetical protein